jgi:hypothetical protein
MMLSVATATLGLFWRPRPSLRPLHGLDVAILLPMYGEAAEETVGNAVQLLAQLSGNARHAFSVHVLSDTRTPAAAALEEAAVAAARWRHPDLAITYRRRLLNTDYKSGNIRDWVVTRGHAHDAMLVLDADSLMGPKTVLQMADALAQEPGLGLIQTIPRVLPGRTIWQGLQSFASDVYGGNMGRGFAMWTGVEGNFLGHNALLRIPAFAASAGLPHLPGKAPRGGVILSHDFVEAALIFVKFHESEAAGGGEAVDFRGEGTGGGIGPWGDEGFEVFPRRDDFQSGGVAEAGKFPFDAAAGAAVDAQVHGAGAAGHRPKCRTFPRDHRRRAGRNRPNCPRARGHRPRSELCCSCVWGKL